MQQKFNGLHWTILCQLKCHDAKKFKNEHATSSENDQDSSPATNSNVQTSITTPLNPSLSMGDRSGDLQPSEPSMRPFSGLKL